MFTLKPVHRKHCHCQAELDVIIKNIKAKKNMLILGPDKIGKSSFFLQLKKNIDASKSFVPILFSDTNCITLESYIKKNLLTILESYNELFPDPKSFLSLSLLELDNKVSELKLSDTAKQCLKLLLVFENDPKASIDDVIRHFFSFPSILAGETKTTAVMMIDDAERLQGIKSGKTSLSIFFDLQNSLDNVVSVLSSSYNLDVGGFEELNLRLLSIEDMGLFLTDHELKLGEKTLTTLYNFTEGVPFYINYFGRLIKHTTKTDSNAITELINDSLSNELHFYFSEKLKSLSPKELPILFCMAEHGVKSPSRISRLINYSQTNVRRFLSIMEEKGFVTLKERGVFEIHDPVFRRWLEVQSRL